MCNDDCSLVAHDSLEAESVAGCKSSKDCPGTLVCAEEVGKCVDCVSDSDCLEGETCGEDNQCHTMLPCDSDKDCKSAGMVCDKVRGICVECVKQEDCFEGEYCLNGYCLPQVCSPGTAQCEGNQVLTCGSDGSGFDVTQECSDVQYCNDGTCMEYLCTPEDMWCEGNLLKICDQTGTTIISQVDCSESDEHCFEGECIETICVPLSAFCIDDATVANCSTDGMAFDSGPCPAEHYCAGGECKPWLCQPGKQLCQGQIAITCNESGSAVIDESDCGALNHVCIDGKCLEQACEPGKSFCLNESTLAQCAEDGLSFEETSCPAQHTCKSGSCMPWQCIPGESLCVGQVATVCAEDGLGPAPGGKDCELQDQFCKRGQCIDCTPSCFAKVCGDDGCGGSCGTCDEQDDDPCTVAACIEGAFSVCGQVPIEGCCQSVADCDDQDSCTHDVCENTQCVHTDVCCEQDSDCNDGTNCTKDFCVGTSCVNKPLKQEGCCPATQFAETFEQGMESGWVLTDDTPHADWVLTAQEAHTGQYSLSMWMKFNESNGGKARAAFPMFTVPPQGGTISFWLKTEKLPGNVVSCLESTRRFEVQVNGYPAFRQCQNRPRAMPVAINIAGLQPVG